MSKSNNLTDFLTDVANTIRTKKGYPSSQKINPQNFSNEISSIVTPSGTIPITANGTYDVTSYATASVNVPGSTPSGTISITANGTYDVSSYASALVNVPSSGGAIMVKAEEGTTSQILTFDGSKTSGYNYFAILFVANSGGFSGMSGVNGIYTHTHSDTQSEKIDAKYSYRSIYYLSSKFYFINSSSQNEGIVRFNDSALGYDYFEANTAYGLNWITNSNQGKYIGFFWN